MTSSSGLRIWSPRTTESDSWVKPLKKMGVNTMRINKNWVSDRGVSRIWGCWKQAILWWQSFDHSLFLRKLRAKYWKKIISSKKNKKRGISCCELLPYDWVSSFFLFQYSSHYVWIHFFFLAAKWILQQSPTTPAVIGKKTSRFTSGRIFGPSLLCL